MSTETTAPKRDRESLSNGIDPKTVRDHVLEILGTQSADDIVTIDLAGKSSIADFMIVASGRSNRHVSALADYVQRGLKELGHAKLGVEGMVQCDWVLIDAGDVILHLFRPEVREYYDLEKMWSLPTMGVDDSKQIIPS